MGFSVIRRGGSLLDPLFCRSGRSHYTFNDQIVVNRCDSGYSSRNDSGFGYIRLSIDEAAKVHNAFVGLNVNIRRG